MLECTADSAASPPRVGCLCHSPAFARLNGLLTSKLSRRSLMAGGIAAGAFGLAASGASAGIPDAPKRPVAFTNIRLFDGRSGEIRRDLVVLVDGLTVKAVLPAGSALPDATQTIDAGNRTLMPGLIDAHWHAMMSSVPVETLLTADIGYITLQAAEEARRTLMRGFTSVRDMAGPSFGLKRAIDAGVVPGPRIWPSGAMISQTGGHGDFRFAYEVPAAQNAPLSHGDAVGAGAIADGAARVLQRAREQLMLGASQVKLAAGGGVASNYDPLDVSQYTRAEFRAAVDAAENWGTYVAVHAYTPRAIQTAIGSGVACIEHGQLMDEATARMIADKGVWLSTQPFLDDEDAIPFPEGSANRAKQLQMSKGTDAAYGYAKAYKLKTAWGTDTLFDAKLAARQGAQLAKMVRWYSPAEVLTMATGTNGDLLGLSGPRNPYPGSVGVIEAGAHADLLLVDGDPLDDIRLLADPDKTLLVIMKAGRFYKRSLPE